MTRSPRALSIFASCALGASVAPATAWAIDDRPTIVSDAFYVGARAEPGWALAIGWDLDIYPTPDRALSLGPGLALTVLSSEPLGPRSQSLSLAIDAVRVKVGLNTPGHLFRPFALVGGGFSWTRFALRVEAAPGAFDESLAGMFTVGAGADVWSRGKFGCTVLLETRIRTGGSDRLPTASFVASVGFRFGL